MQQTRLQRGSIYNCQREKQLVIISKMAPACCTASRRILSILEIISVFMIIMLLSPLAASSVLRYDRSTLLEIKASVNFEDSYSIDGGQTLNFSKHLLSKPPELCRRHCGSYSKKKRCKRRGKHGGWLAKNVTGQMTLCFFGRGSCRCILISLCLFFGLCCYRFTVGAD